VKKKKKTEKIKKNYWKNAAAPLFSLLGSLPPPLPPISLCLGSKNIIIVFFFEGKKLFNQQKKAKQTGTEKSTHTRQREKKKQTK